MDQLDQFGGLGGFWKQMCMPFNIILFSVVWTIWTERDKRIFRHKEEQLQFLAKKVKLHSF